MSPKSGIHGGLCLQLRVPVSRMDVFLHLWLKRLVRNWSHISQNINWVFKFISVNTRLVAVLLSDFWGQMCFYICSDTKSSGQRFACQKAHVFYSVLCVNISPVIEQCFGQKLGNNDSQIQVLTLNLYWVYPEIQFIFLRQWSWAYIIRLEIEDLKQHPIRVH